MKKFAIISENSSYTFSDYFKLVDYRDEIFDYFGYSFQKGNYELPRITYSFTHLKELKANLERNMAYVSITNETAKREFIIAPILMDIVDYSHPKIRVEFPLNLNNQLNSGLKNQIVT